MLRGWAHFLNLRVVVIAGTIVVMHLAVSIAIAVSVVISLFHYAIDLFFLLLCISVCPVGSSSISSVCSVFKMLA